MDDSTGITKMGTQLVAGDSRLGAGPAGSVSTYRAWQVETAAPAAFAANGMKPATCMLTDVPSTHRHRRLRGSP